MHCEKLNPMYESRTIQTCSDIKKSVFALQRQTMMGGEISKQLAIVTDRLMRKVFEIASNGKLKTAEDFRNNASKAYAYAYFPHEASAAPYYNLYYTDKLLGCIVAYEFATKKTREVQAHFMPCDRDVDPEPFFTMGLYKFCLN